MMNERVRFFRERERERELEMNLFVMKRKEREDFSRNHLNVSTQ